MYMGRRASVVDIGTRLQVGGYGFRMPVAARGVLFSRIF